MSRRSVISHLGLFASVAVMAGGIAACGSGDSEEPAAPAGAASTEVAERALQSTVAITVRRGDTTITGTGTKLGEGLIVTDRRLVTDSSGAALASVSVRDPDGGEHSGIVDGTDEVSGLAALRVRDIDTMPSLPSGGEAALGDELTAVGWISARRPAVRPGVVVSAGRSVRHNGVAVVGLWESTANLGVQAVGAPVIDGQGRAVGITTRALAALIPGSAVVLPIGTAEQIAKALRSEGRVRRAFLGIESVGVTPSRARELKLKTSAGLILRATMPGSPASFADFKEPTGSRTIGGREIPSGGDVIVEIGDTKLAEPEDLDAALAKVKPGTQVRLRVIRGDRSVVVPVRTGER